MVAHVKLMVPDQPLSRVLPNDVPQTFLLSSSSFASFFLFPSFLWPLSFSVWSFVQIELASIQFNGFHWRFPSGIYSAMARWKRGPRFRHNGIFSNFPPFPATSHVPKATFSTVIDVYCAHATRRGNVSVGTRPPFSVPFAIYVLGSVAFRMKDDTSYLFTVPF